MIERIDDMPAGTIGVRASGKVTPEEYRRVLLPPMQSSNARSSGSSTRDCSPIGDRMIRIGAGA